MSVMFWIALKPSISKIEFNIMIYLTVKKLDAFKFYGVAESDKLSVSLKGMSIDPTALFKMH